MASSCLDRTVSTATENSVGELDDEGTVTVTLNDNYRPEDEFKQDSESEMKVKNLGKKEAGSDYGHGSLTPSSVLENTAGDSGSAYSDAKSLSPPLTEASIQKSAALLVAPSRTLPATKRKPPSLSQLVSVDKKTSSSSLTSSPLTSRSSPCPSSFSLNSPATPSTTSPPSMPLSMSSSLISPSSQPSVESTINETSASSQALSFYFPALLPSSDSAAKDEPPEQAYPFGHHLTPPTVAHASSADQRRYFDFQLAHALTMLASDSKTNSIPRGEDGTSLPTDDSPKQQKQQVHSSLRSSSPLVVPAFNSAQQSEKTPSSSLKTTNQRFRTNNILSRMLLPTFNVSSSAFFSSSASSSPGSPSSISPSALYPPSSSLSSEIPLSPLPSAPPPPTPPPPTTPPPTALLSSPNSTPPPSSPP